MRPDETNLVSLSLMLQDTPSQAITSDKYIKVQEMTVKLKKNVEI